MDKSIQARRKAQKLAREEKIPAAIEEMSRLLAEAETDPYDHVYLGDLLLRDRRAPEAIDAWMQAVQAYERAGLNRNAIATCKKILRLDQHRVPVHRTLGDLYYQEGLMGEAVPHFLQYLDSVSPDDKFSEEFLETLERATSVVGLQIEAALRLADHYLRIKQEDRAAQLLRQIAEKVIAAGGAAEAVEALRLRAEEAEEASRSRLAPPEAAGPELPAVDPASLDATSLSFDAVPASLGDEPASLAAEPASRGNEPASFAAEAAGNAGTGSSAPSDAPFDLTAEGAGTSALPEPLEPPAGREAAPAGSLEPTGPGTAESGPGAGGEPRSGSAGRAADPGAGQAYESVFDPGLIPGLESAAVSGSASAVVPDHGRDASPEIRPDAGAEAGPELAMDGPVPVAPAAGKPRTTEGTAEALPVEHFPLPRTEEPSETVWDLEADDAEGAGSAGALDYEALVAEANAAEADTGEAHTAEAHTAEAHTTEERAAAAHAAGDAARSIAEDAGASSHLGEVSPGPGAETDGATAEADEEDEEETAPRRLTERAEEAFARGDWAEARRRFERALHEQPLEPVILGRLVEIARHLSDAAAEVHYLTLLGDAWIETGELEEALETFLRVLNVDPENTTARRRLSRFREMGVPGAERIPEETRNSIAGVLETSGARLSVAEPKPSISSDEWVDLGALLEEFRTGVKNQIAGDDHQSHYDLAVSHRGMGLLEEAIEEADTVLAEPNLPPDLECSARELRGLCLLDLARHREAVHEFRTALERLEEAGRRPGFHYHLAVALESVSEWQDAAESFERALSVAPAYLDAGARLAACRSRAREAETAGAVDPASDDSFEEPGEAAQAA